MISLEAAAALSLSFSLSHLFLSRSPLSQPPPATPSHLHRTSPITPSTEILPLIAHHGQPSKPISFLIINAVTGRLLFFRRRPGDPDARGHHRRPRQNLRRPHPPFSNLTAPHDPSFPTNFKNLLPPHHPIYHRRPSSVPLPSDHRFSPHHTSTSAYSLFRPSPVPITSDLPHPNLPSSSFPLTSSITFTIIATCNQSPDTDVHLLRSRSSSRLPPFHSSGVPL